MKFPSKDFPSKECFEAWLVLPNHSWGQVLENVPGHSWNLKTLGISIVPDTSFQFVLRKKKNYTTIWCFGFPTPRNGEGIIYPLELSRTPWCISKLFGNKQASAIWWSKIQITLKLIFLIYSHQPHYKLLTWDAWSFSGEGTAEDRVGSGLTSSSPADVEAGQGCTRAARTWGRASQQTRGCRQSTATEIKDSELNSWSWETLIWVQQ